MNASPAPRASRLPSFLILLVTLTFGALAASAMLHASTSFDEIVFSAAGARGFANGHFGLVPDHPRLAEYLYGLPLYLSGVAFPPEELARTAEGLPHYVYARALFWQMGNDPERIAIPPRLVALAFGMLVVLATGLLAKRHQPPWAALFAAVLVAFIPDMLAHSGIAYNDVPLALGILVSVYALDDAMRRPTIGRVALAGLLCALSASLKYSGLILGPIAIALLAIEATSGRWREAEWRRAIAIAMPVFLGVAYLALVLVYLGDWRLAEFAGGLEKSVRMTGAGRDAFLLGDHYPGGRWYFFPVVFALKTPVALHLLMVLAAVGAWSVARGTGWRSWLGHGARAPAIGAAFFLLALITTPLNIGFRHALPLLPLVCILIAQGLTPIWSRARAGSRTALAFVLAAFIISGARHYPFYISYLSEYAAGRALHETLVDSSTDWGQGLLALRTLMDERGAGEVALGYMGSALPEGYGIHYVAMPSYFPLRSQPTTSGEPRYVVISATLLAGTVRSDPYAAFRRLTPIAIVGGSLYVFDRQIGAVAQR